MRYAVTPEDCCLSAMDFQTPTSGSGGPVSVWSKNAYVSKKDVVDAATTAAIAWFDKNAKTSNSSCGEDEREDSRRIVAALSQQYAQPSLF